MTGSYLAWAVTDVAGTVAIGSDYKGIEVSSPGFQVSSITQSLVFRRVQILVYRNFEVHQLASLCVGYTGDVNIGARQRRGNTSNVEEEKTGLRAVRFDRLGGELRGLNLIHLFSADASLHFMGERNRTGPRT